jgi:hypothetical protein
MDEDLPADPVVSRLAIGRAGIERRPVSAAGAAGAWNASRVKAATSPRTTHDPVTVSKSPPTIVNRGNSIESPPPAPPGCGEAGGVDCV